MSPAAAPGEASAAEIEARLQASREALAADVDVLAARFSPKGQVRQAGRRVRDRVQGVLSPLLQQAETGLRGAADAVRQAQAGDAEARRLLGAVAGSATVLLAAVAIGSRIARD